MRAALTPEPRPSRLPLSFGQERLWFLSRLRGESCEYNLPFGLWLEGELKVRELHAAFGHLVARHESLRTRFEEVEGEAVQRIEPTAALHLPVVDLTGLPEAARRQRVERALACEGRAPFDLTRAPLLRARLLRCSPRRHALLHTSHHIVSDGWSEGILHRELMALYEALANDEGNPLPPLVVQYGDYALWERRRFAAGDFDAGRRYWRRQLAALPERLDLPTDRRRDELGSAAVAVVESLLPPSLGAALRQTSGAHQATPFMTLLTGLGALLWRSSGQEDFGVGSPIANREQRELEPLIGLFVNLIVTRMRVTGQTRFAELLGAVAASTWEAYQHQEVPFARLVEELAPHRGAHQTPLFQVLFVLQGTSLEAQPRRLPLTVEPFVGDAAEARFDLEIHALPRPDGGLLIRWLYPRELFGRWRVTRLARHYEALLRAFVAAPDRRIGEVELVSAAERWAVVGEWNATSFDWPEETVLARIGERAARDADSVAVVCGGDHLSRGGLDQLSLRLALLLRSHVAGPEEVVGVALERSPTLIAALLAVWKAGAAYLPLDPAYPTTRLAYMVKDAGVRLLLARRELGTEAAASAPGLVVLDPFVLPAPAGDQPASWPAARPRGLAYVIYTSGSTGRPKGVAIEQRHAAALLRWAETVFTPADRARLFASTSVCFDLSIFELFLPLSCGGTVLLARHDALDFPEIAHREAPTLVNTVPSAMAELVGGKELPPSLRVVNLAGEPLSRELVRVIDPERRLRIYDLYGPSETTTYSTWARRHPDGPETIGRPIANTRAWLLDDRLEPVPIGIAGELYLGGRGVARGYLRRPLVTAERFVAAPWGGMGERMYRTGDLARCLPDGNMQFLGRVDHQVKVRGFRIELGEIEATLRSHPEVREAVVVVRQSEEERRLVAYVTRREDSAEAAALRRRQVEEWEEVWEQLYAGDAAEAPDLDLTGWRDSASGQPIPRHEMLAWIDCTVARLLELEPQRVLEIGCGTGLIASRLAPRCARYVGLDLSPSVLARLGRLAASRSDLAHLERVHGFAHQLDFLADGSVDLVVLNSVAQYFPDLAYFLDVLRQALRVTSPGGHIFLGDLRSLPLFEAFHTSVELERADPQTTVGELARRVKRAMLAEEELLFDPRLFAELGRLVEGVGRARVLLKAGGYDNELSRFRYDVLLRVGPHEEPAAPAQALSWDEAGRWRSELGRLLAAEPGRSISLGPVVDRRAAPAVEQVRRLAEAEAGSTVGELGRRLESDRGADPDQLLALARELGVECLWQELGPEAKGRVLFNPEWRAVEGDDAVSLARLSRYTNHPARASGRELLAAVLKADLAARLPAPMVPHSVVVLAALPLTPNGKLDRGRLPAPEESLGSERYQAAKSPEEEILAEIFATVLGRERVGIHDDFFALGGHSLLATRLASRIRSVLAMEVSVRTVFEAPTVERLVRKLRPLAAERPRLTRQLRPPVMPLSYAQQRLWFVDRLGQGSAEYNVPLALRLSGELDVAALRWALAEILARHESLRTSFEEIDGEGAQRITSAASVELPVVDLAALPVAAARSRVLAGLAGEWSRPFDFGRAPLLRLRLFRLAAGEHVWLRTVAHIAWDGWSESLFHQELEALYRARRAGLPSPLAPLEVQYADFTLWQRRWLESGALDHGLGYWRRQLADLPDPLELPADRPRQETPRFVAGELESRLDAAEVATLKRLGREHGATLFMILLAALAALVFRLTGQGDLVVATPIANRDDPEQEKLIGFFVNLLLLRLRPAAGQSFAALLAAVRATTLAATQHQEVPFERVVQELSTRRGTGAPPVAQLVLTLQNAPWSPPRLAGLEVEPLGLSGPRVPVELAINAVFAPDESLRLLWLYNRELFDPWRIEQLAQELRTLLATMTRSLATSLRTAALLTVSERAEVLARWAGSSWPVSGGTVFELFRSQAASVPEAVAVESGEEWVSYAELAARGHRVAVDLGARGIGAEALVAVSLPRSIELVVAMLAIAKAGAAFLPIDPDAPPERRAVIVEDSRPAAELGFAELRRSATPAPEVSFPPPHAEQACYVIYTSGSTGRPKGVVIPHRALLNKVVTLNHLHGISGATRYGVSSPISFDPILEQVWSPLVAGGRAVVFALDFRHHLDAFADYVEERRPTVLPISVALTEHWSSTPPLGRFRPEVLIMGGDVIESTLANRLLGEQRARRIFNAYGPTEVCVDASWYEISAPVASATVPIGRPAPNYHVYVLDAGLEPAPAGVGGELYVAAPGLARGYFGRPAETAERFVADPYGPPGRRLYRSGDFGRFRPDGELEFLGRSDEQVKIRGFRVELGEIEAALSALPGVAQAAVVVRSAARRGERSLVAYLAPRPGRELEPTALRELLRERLPVYMVPADWVVLSALPLTPNGKVDRKALPAPQPLSVAADAPASAGEQLVAELLAALLGRERVGLDEDFFDLGGHSLLAARLASRLRATFEVELSIAELLDAGTVRGMARRLSGPRVERPALAPAPRPARLPLSFAQQRLWFLDRLEGPNPQYNMALGLRLRGALDAAALERAITTIVARHESLRTHFEEVGGEAFQVIEPSVDVPLEREDWSALSPALQAERARQALAAEWRRPFDLSRGPLLRARLIRLGAEEHLWLRTLHHISSDGWSEGVFHRELAELYGAYCAGRESPLPPLAVQYGDFTLWQRAWLGSGALDAGLATWRRELADLPERLELPRDGTPGAHPSFAAGVVRAALTTEESAAFRALSSQHGVTLYMSLLAAFAVLLSHGSGQEDLLVGSPIANRQEPQLEALIGFFVNTLVLRVRVKPTVSFRDLLAQVRTTTLRAFEHQDVPFERVVEEVSPERMASATPLFQVLFAFQNAPFSLELFPGLAVSRLEEEEMQVRADLELHAGEIDGRLSFLWIYRRQLFAAPRIEQMARQLLRLLAAVTARPERSVGAIDLLDEQEQLALLASWNSAEVEA